MSDPTARPHFQELQYAFAAHLRNPELHRAPEGIEDRRLKIYRELFYNNVESFLANAYPVLRKLSSDAVWHARIRDYYTRHQARSPLFHEMPEEFLHYLQSERGEHPDDPPFLCELAHYEWVELALSVSEEELTPELADPNGDPMQAPPMVSPLAWPMAYVWPVHRISVDFQPEQPPAEPSYLVVYRTRQYAVKFMEINAVTARLLQLIEENPTSSGSQLMQQIATELNHPQPEQVIEGGQALLASLRDRDIVVGTRWPEQPR
tara:strand:+ start:7667 stop:8455 length:789 start_codon:yes stop_codon:yes gene_type:complete